MQLISIILTTLALIGLAQGVVTFTNCAAGPTVMTVTSFFVLPEPLCINHNMCATATGTLSTPIFAAAKYAVTGRYLGRIVYTDNQDFCALLDQQGQPCTVPATVTSLTACTLVKPNAPAYAQVTFTNCATSSTQLDIETFGVAPYPLCVNKNICLTSTGTLTTPIIAGSTLVITGRYLGKLVYSDSHDFCTLLGAQGFPCPIPVTAHALTACVLVKPECPVNVALAMTFETTNGDNGKIYCQKGTMTATYCP
ncbi:hypothetical protein BGX30_014470 [Mortierella sp. GBA39]|nr:hypothetical protein BGX30_014470 [Mortierella sp. GBA39]